MYGCSACGLTTAIPFAKPGGVMRMLAVVLLLWIQVAQAQSDLRWEAETLLASGTGVFLAFNNTAVAARDAQGRAMAVWADGSAPVLGRQGSNSIWSNTALPKLSASALARKPSVNWAGSQPIVAWTENTGATTRVVATRSVDGGVNWQPPIELASGNLETPVSLSAFSRSDGSLGAAIAWYDTDANTVYSRGWRGNTWAAYDWSEAVALTRAGGQGHDVSLGGRMDTVWAAWEDNRSGSKELWLNRSTDGGLSWEQDRRLPRQDGGSASGQDPSLALSANGSIHLAYQISGKVYLAVSTDGGASFAAPRTLGNGLFGHASANGYSSLAFSWEDFTGDLYDDSIKRVGLSVSLDHLASVTGPYAMPQSDQTVSVVQGAVVVSADWLDVLWIDVSDPNGNRVLKHRAARIEAAQFAAAVSGSRERQSIDVLWRIAHADLGQPGSGYLAANAGANWWLYDGSTWRLWSGGPLPAVASGSLNHGQLAVLSNADVTGLTGVRLYAAYQREGGALVFQQILVFP